MKTRQYMILKSDNLEELVKLVNSKLEMVGYEVIGGITIETNPHFKPVFYQAMLHTAN